jgi:hypothetical protein
MERTALAIGAVAAVLQVTAITGRLVAVETNRADSGMNYSLLCAGTNGFHYPRLPLEVALRQLRQQVDMTNLVKQLVADGDVCNAIGHKWQYGCSVGPGCLVIHSGPIRHCVVCRKEETQRVGPWE